MSLSCAVSER